MIVLRWCLQQTLFMFFCVASEECQERILRRSSQRFSTTRYHPVRRNVSRPQTEQGKRFVIGLSISPFDTRSSVDRGAGQEAWIRALAEWDGKHPVGRVETKREMNGAGVAEPEMFTPPELPPVAFESAAGVSRKSFGQKQLAFAQGTEGNRAGWVCTFMKHGAVSNLLFCGGLAREIPPTVHARGRRTSNHIRSHLSLVPVA